MFRASRLLFAALIVAVGTSHATAALVTYDLIAPLPGSDGGFAGTGSISFNDTSGSGVADPDFLAFSFTVTNQPLLPPPFDPSRVVPLPFTFTKFMVSNINWVITPLGSLGLELDVNTQTVDIYTYDLAFDSMQPFTTSVRCYTGGEGIAFAPVATFCTGVPDQGDLVSNANLFAMRASVAVPESASIALLSLALAGLGLARRRKQ